MRKVESILLVFGVLVFATCSDDTGRQDTYSETASSPSVGTACVGSDLQRSIEIIESAWLEGLTIGRAGTDFAGAMQQLIAISQQLNNQAQQLPQPCQRLIQTWAEIIAQMLQSPPPETTCKFGVCCDNRGCYG